MKKVCVIGYPAKHSLSPAIHSYWLEKYGIEGKYEIREIEPDKFDNFFLNLQDEGYIGCNVTVPYKERAFELSGNTRTKSGIGDFGPSLQSMFIGAVNTVLVKKYQQDKKYEYFAANTDVDGFIKNIEVFNEKFDFTKGKAVILGAGGASRAILFCLLSKNTPEIIITNRSKDRAEKLKEKIEKDNFFIKILNSKNKIIVVDWDSRNEALVGANLLVNTTSLGMVGQPELDIDLSLLPKDALVTDIVYRPLETTLLKNAKARGNPTVDGLGMLLYQAKPGFEMWFAEELKAKGIKGVEVTPELRTKIESLL